MTRGFTLIETVVAVGVFAVLSVVGSVLLFGILRGSKKSAAVAVVRGEGANIINNMTAMLRFAQEISVCSGNTITFKPQAGDDITYTIIGNSIASNSAVIASNQVLVNNLVFVCTPVVPKTKIININFLLKRDPTTSVFDQAEIPFQTQVVLRNRD